MLSSNLLNCGGRFKGALCLFSLYYGFNGAACGRQCSSPSLLHILVRHVQTELPDMVAVADADFSAVDAVFCCLPHGTTQEIIAALPSHLKIVDLSAVRAL